MVHRFLWILGLVLLMGHQVQAQKPNYSFLLHKPYAERYLALDTLFFNNKVSTLDSTQFFREIESIAQLARKAGDQELLLETRFLRYEYYMVGKQENNALFEPNMLALREEADARELLQLQIRIRQKLGYYYFYIAHRYGAGFENYLASYELLKNVSAKVIPDKQELIADIGSAYWQFGDNQKALEFMTEAQGVSPGSYKKRFPINLTNTIGLVYRVEKKFDKAEVFFRKAYALAVAAKDSAWMGIASGNLGMNYFFQKQYGQALPLLELDVKESIKANEMDNALASLIKIARIHQI